MLRKLCNLNRVGSLKNLLIYWIAGSGLVLVIVYSSMVEVNFRFGAKLVLAGNLEWYAQHFESAYLKDKNTPLPNNLGLKSYRNLADLPEPVYQLMKERKIKHRGLEFFLEHTTKDKTKLKAFRDKSICDIRVCDVLFLFPYKLKNGEWIYIVQGLAGSDKLYEDNDHIEYVFITLTIVILLSIGALAWRLVKKVSTPVEDLARWAKQLSTEDAKTSPDFQYKELNQVAEQLQQALIEIRASVDKEHQFLQQVSHELRTPLAIASGNIDIINLIAQHSPKTKQEADAIARLSHAVNDMTQLTDTILWLNRELGTLPELTQVNLLKLSKSIVEDNQYLLVGKQVEVEVIGDCVEFDSSPVLCSILLSNLIRNAFQHTFEGKVTVSLNQLQFDVKNENVSKTKDSGSEVYGFGLGLILVEQIAQRMQWHYQCEELETGWLASVRFDN